MNPPSSDFFPPIDTSNDDPIPRVDEDTDPQNDHIYVIDGPGDLNNGAHDQVVARRNFREFVRIGLDGEILEGNNSQGSRCSNKVDWRAFYWVEKNGGKYAPRDGKTNEVEEGHMPIGNTPTP